MGHARRDERTKHRHAVSRTLRVDLARPLMPIDVADRDASVYLVVSHGPAVLGVVLCDGPLSSECLLAQIEGRLGERVAEHLLRLALRRAVLRTPATADPGSPTTVVIASRHGGEQLQRTAATVASLPGAGRVLLTGPRGQGLPLRDLARSLEAERSTWVAFTTDAATPEPTWLTDLPEEAADSLLACLTGFTAAPPAAPRLDLGTRRVLSTVSLADDGELDSQALAERLTAPENLIVRRELVSSESGLRTAIEHPSQLLHHVLREGFRVVYDPARAVFADAYAPTDLVTRRRRRARPRVRAPFAIAPAVARAPSGPPLSVVIPSFNRRDDLLRLLAALERQAIPQDAFEVVIVLDGSTDGSHAALRGRESPLTCRVLDQPNRGVAASRNAGIRAATHDIVVNLDDDMVPAPGFVAAHASAHRGADPSYVAVGRAVTQPLGRADLWSLYQRAEWEDHYRRKAEPEHSWSYFDFSVGNTSLHRSLLDRAGWFDETMRRHDDQECGVRLVGAGARLGLREDALAWHLPSAGLRSGLAHVRAQARFDVELARRHPRLGPTLPLTSMGSGDRPLSTQAQAVFRTPILAGLALDHGPWTVHVLERALGRTWSAPLIRRLTATAYVRGLRDAVPSLSELGQLVEQLDAPAADRVRVELTHPAPLVFDPAGGPVELHVTLDDVPLAATSRHEPIREWTWDALERRLMEQMLAARLPLERLLRLSPTV